MKLSTSGLLSSTARGVALAALLITDPLITGPALAVEQSLLEEKVAREGFDVTDFNAKVHPRLHEVLEGDLEDAFTKAAMESTVRIDVHLQNFEKSAAHRRALKTKAGLERRKSKVQAAQERVFTEMQGLYGLDRFQLKRRFESFYGFTADADYRAVAALAELDSVVEISYAERPEFDDAEALTLTNTGAAHALGHTGLGVTVAVIDGGINYTHYAFGGYSTFPNAKVIGGVDLANEDDDPLADCNGDYHGTPVASIVAGNGGGITGAAPEATLVHIKIADSCTSTYGTIPGAIDWVISNHQSLGIDIVTMSLSWDVEYSDYCDSIFGSGFRTKLQTLYDLDIHFFSSASNDGNKAGIASPSCSSHITSVGAVFDSDIGSHSYGSLCTDSTTSGDLVPCYSNSAEILDLLGPAECAKAARTTGTTWSCFGGTSSATPFVAGVAATVLEAQPSLTREGLIFALKDGGTDVTDPGNGVTNPRVDALTSSYIAQNLDSSFVLALDSSGQGEGEVLYRIDETNANTYDVGALSVDQTCASDLVQATDDGLFYGVGCEETGGGTSFFSVDPLSGHVTDIATLWGDETTATTLAFDATTDTLYAMNVHKKYRGKVLMTIDRTTGETIRVGSLWGDRSGATSIAFVSGQLYGINSTGWGVGKVLFKIDTSNARVDDVGSLSGDHTLASSIRTAPDGTMYAINWSGSTGGFGHTLFTINVTDASTTEIGRLSGDRTHASALVIYQ
ncbi:MAG: S8 family serine peptidase [Acidobacteriota bacterium]